MTTKKDMSNGKKRVEFDFSAEAFQKLNELKENTDASSNAEVVRNALRLYEWFVEKKKEKAKIFVSSDGETMREVELMF